jgi:hypothetical protein
LTWSSELRNASLKSTLLAGAASSAAFGGATEPAARVAALRNCATIASIRLLSIPIPFMFRPPG